MVKIRHLTHNNGFSPWCCAPEVRYSLYIGDTILEPYIWCPHCRGMAEERGIKLKEPLKQIPLGECCTGTVGDGAMTHVPKLTGVFREMK